MFGRSRLISPLESFPRPKPVQVSWSAVRAEALAALPDPGLGRSPCRSPFGSPRPAEALAVHLSGKPVPAEADRCFPAGKNVSRSWHPFRLAPRQSRSSGGSPPKRRAGRSRSVSSGWIPIRAEARPVHLWRFREAEASGSTGLLDEACRPCKSEGQARCVRMAAASSAALAVTSRIFACGQIRKRFRPQPGPSSRGAINPATTGTCHGKPSRQSRFCLWITRITGVESAALGKGDCVDRATLLWASAFLSPDPPRRRA